MGIKFAFLVVIKTENETEVTLTCFPILTRRKIFPEKLRSDLISCGPAERLIL